MRFNHQGDSKEEEASFLGDFLGILLGTKKAQEMGKCKFYAVKVGRKPGIYQSWDECKAQVNGFSKACFKGFSTQGEAQGFLGDIPEADEAKQTTAVAAEGAEVKVGAMELVATPPAEAEAAGGPPTTSLDALLTACISANQQQVADPATLYRLEFDGASRSNPGPAGAGAVLMTDSDGRELGRVCVGLGSATNNVAEYIALVLGVQAALDVGVRRLKVAGDSMLVVNQMKGQWRINNAGLVPLHQKALELSSQFQEFSISHVYREHNKIADALSNEAIDTPGWAGLKLTQAAGPPDVGGGGGYALGSKRRATAELSKQPLGKSMMGGSWGWRRNGLLHRAAPRALAERPLQRCGLLTYASLRAEEPAPMDTSEALQLASGRLYLLQFAVLAGRPQPMDTQQQAVDEMGLSSLRWGYRQSCDLQAAAMMASLEQGLCSVEGRCLADCQTRLRGGFVWSTRAAALPPWRWGVPRGAATCARLCLRPQRLGLSSNLLSDARLEQCGGVVQGRGFRQFRRPFQQLRVPRALPGKAVRYLAVSSCHLMAFALS